jgi:thiosulfate/3-mercaptopyruvate sulfurtransferase
MKIKVLLFAALAILSTNVDIFADDVVDAAYVAAALKRGAIVWDVRGADEYAHGHIPGALNIGNVADVLRNPNSEDFIPTVQVEKLLNEAGIDLSREIIVYSRMGDPGAHFGLLTVRHFGGKQCKVFHGGLDEWQAAGQPVTMKGTKLPAVEQNLTIDPTAQIYLTEVLSKLNSPDVQFVDARTLKEFSGDDIHALRGGHIPGALSIPFEQNWVDPDTAKKLAKGDVKTRDGMALKPAAELKALYANLDPAKETIVYCQSGGRASETATVLRSLSFENVRVFEERWLGYGNDLSAPAEAVQFVNVGALNARIRSLATDVENLKIEVEALRAARRVSGKIDSSASD